MAVSQGREGQAGRPELFSTGKAIHIGAVARGARSMQDRQSLLHIVQICHIAFLLSQFPAILFALHLR